MADDFGLIGTIGEEDDVELVEETSASDLDEPVNKKPIKRKTLKSNKNKSEEFNGQFEFDDLDDDFENWGLDQVVAQAKNSATGLTLDDKIARVRREKKKQAQGKSNEKTKDASDSEVDEEEVWTSEEENNKRDTIRIKEKKAKKKKKGKTDELVQFSSEITGYDENLSFQDMNLSRPLLTALSAMSFHQPTPIQIATIPTALLGKDLCACAATGTGKTAAFMLPILERLLYKPKHEAVTRVLVLTPTRELAVQIHSVSRQLAQCTKVEISLSAGGLDIKAQEAALRLGPDVVIATPGRLIDHLHNSPNFNLSSIEILVLDEADRMLDEYFAEQMKEVIRLCSRTRQTMLFSATMTEAVEDLAAVSLKNPVKIFVNQATDVALHLRQEFIRIRANREGDREAILAALLKRTFHDHCIVFIQTKKQAHRLHILYGLMGIRVGELHSSLSQAQRLEALQKFKDGDLDVLLATDLAARGLDIVGVKTIINFTMPSTLQHYIHRVGRTARAGKSGRSVTLVGEKERKVLKEIVKKAKTPVKSRVIPPEVIFKFRQRLASFENDVIAIEKQEAEERQLRALENQTNKAQKIIDGNTERKRTWFQSHMDRKKEQAALRLSELTKLPKNKKERKKFLKGKQLQNADERAEFELQKAAAYAARVSKKHQKEKRLRSCMDRDKDSLPAKRRKTKKKSSFEKDLTSTSGKVMKQLRAGPTYQERKKLGMVNKKTRNPKNRKRK